MNKKKELRETIKLIFAIIMTIGGCYLAEFASNWLFAMIITIGGCYLAELTSNWILSIIVK